MAHRDNMARPPVRSRFDKYLSNAPPVDMNQYRFNENLDRESQMNHIERTQNFNAAERSDVDRTLNPLIAARLSDSTDNTIPSSRSQMPNVQSGSSGGKSTMPLGQYEKGGRHSIGIVKPQDMQLNPDDLS